MGLLEELSGIYAGYEAPFLITPEGSLDFVGLTRAQGLDDADVLAGDVVAIIGDFGAESIRQLIELVDRGTIVVPLTPETRQDHAYFFDAAGVEVVIEGGKAQRIAPRREEPLLEQLRRDNRPGLVLFSTGTTGRPKAILHDFSLFLARYRTPRPTLRTLSFLLFDHIGGVNTLFHTLFNRGTLIVPSGREPEKIAADIERHQVELLPTSPTFLRMLLMSGLLERQTLPSLRIVTYGTERMDPATLVRLCEQLPQVQFRQTYGMSELSILRVKSQSRESLWMKIGGEGIETRIQDGVLKIKAENRMLGYLNAPSPFDAEGWYDTGDLVEADGEFIRITGRVNDIINVGGIKVLPEEVENAAVGHPDIMRAKVRGVDNPITGQYIELTCEPRPEASPTRKEIRKYLEQVLPEAKRPHGIKVGRVAINHRFKQS
ncbi:MAG: long-chain fatty acid--CoA ligase [Magnetococcales bacterium]|nr:long-chain fatty acid--CoA ligase [Magnetococcales bacterium]